MRSIATTNQTTNDRSNSNKVSTLPAVPKPQTAKEVIAANVKLLIEQLEAGHSEGLTAYLAAMGKFHNYSLGNILEIARQKPDATRVAGLYAWNQLGRKVSKGQKGIRILAPMIGFRRKKDDEAKAGSDPAAINAPVLVGFRPVYVFDRLSRDLRPAWPATVLRRMARMSCVRLDASSHIIAQFAGPLQGGLDTDEFQLAGGYLAGGLVVSFCCV